MSCQLQAGVGLFHQFTCHHTVMAEVSTPALKGRLCKDVPTDRLAPRSRTDLHMIPWSKLQMCRSSTVLDNRLSFNVGVSVPQECSSCYCASRTSYMWSIQFHFVAQQLTNLSPLAQPEAECEKCCSRLIGRQHTSAVGCQGSNVLAAADQHCLY